MENSAFLDDNYEVPQRNSPYLKLKEGDNVLRILSKPIIGWEDWTAEKKPVRFRMNDKPAKPINPKNPVKHFWAMLVWNYEERKIQILEITQKTIQESIRNLSKDEDWGNPGTYDIKIVRKGVDLESEYSVAPKPHKAISEEIKQAFNDTPCFLDNLFDGGDPFSPTEEITEMISDLPF